MFSQTETTTTIVPAQKFNYCLNKLIDDLSGVLKKYDVSTEAKQDFTCLVSAAKSLTKTIANEEVGRPEFEVDYTLMQTESMLSYQLEVERKEYKNACAAHSQQVAQLESQLSLVQKKIIKVKSSNVIADCYELAKEEKLSEVFDDKINFLSERIVANQRGCKFFDSVARAQVKSDDKEINQLWGKRKELESKDMHTVQSSLLTALEGQQSAIEKQLDRVSREQPARPSGKLSIEHEVVKTKIDNAEEAHQSSLSREAMYQVLRAYLLFKNVYTALSKSDVIHRSGDEKSSLIKTVEQSRQLLATANKEIEKVIHKLWCPTSDNKKIKHFCDAFAHAVASEQKSFLAKEMSNELLDKYIPDCKEPATVTGMTPA